MTTPVDFEREIGMTKPDHVVYRPRGGDSGDTGNEHFLVFDGPDGSLMTVWTQSTAEGRSDQHIVFSRSDDEGQTWTKPRKLAGADPKTGKGMASWGFPLVSKSGRIYVLYSRHIGMNDIFTHTTGWLGAICSDDAGKTWSEEELVPMRRTIYDNPDSTIPPNIIVWQKPIRLSCNGKYYTGLTRWVSPSRGYPPPTKSWTSHASVVEFIRFENLDENPRPRDLRLTFFAQDDQAIKVGMKEHPHQPVVQEPSLVNLPNGWLFCAMRTMSGHPYYTVSEDGGETWRKPEPMRRFDNGPLLLHPLSPCPIYQTHEGDYFFLFHNHDGHWGKWGPEDTSQHRRPICIARGEFRKGAHQPVWFSEPKVLMDHDGVGLGPPPPGTTRTDLAMYASCTCGRGKTTLWYPDRKFFLLGKKIGRVLMDALPVKQ
ncbi:MAG: sialidase family protein [Verrucomicrobiae bacterium]|nr:sialidase family protein [Verrucomicrobiae bacterium]